MRTIDIRDKQKRDMTIWQVFFTWVLIIGGLAHVWLRNNEYKEKCQHKRLKLGNLVQMNGPSSVEDNRDDLWTVKETYYWN